MFKVMVRERFLMVLGWLIMIISLLIVTSCDFDRSVFYNGLGETDSGFDSSSSDVPEATKDSVTVYTMEDSEDSQSAFSKWFTDYAQNGGHESENDAGATNNNSATDTTSATEAEETIDAEPEPVPEPTPAPPTTVQKDYSGYSNTKYNFSLEYPSDWKKQDSGPSEVKFSGGKIVLSEATSIQAADTGKQPDTFTVTVTYLPLPNGQNFNEWFSKFPKGSEKITHNGNTYYFVDYDTGGPFGREYYKAVKKESATLKFFLNFMPGYFPPIGDSDSYKYNEYVKKSREFSNLIYKEFVKMIESSK